MEQHQRRRSVSQPSSDGESIRSVRLPPRKASLYAAIAGKIGQNGFLTKKSYEQGHANKPLRPDEVLFKTASAPTRYEETDYYFAHRELPRDQRLPSSDLLNALHGYIAKIFDRFNDADNGAMRKCMEETALIAFGILVEETVKEVLGEASDLTLLEDSESDEEEPSAQLPLPSSERPSLRTRRPGTPPMQAEETQVQYLERLLRGAKAEADKRRWAHQLEIARQDEKAEWP